MSDNRNAIKRWRTIALMTMIAVTTVLPALQTAAATPTTLQDGSSMASAIPIKAADEKAGVTAEYRWIGEHFPGYHRGAQSLLNNNGRFYDAIDITTASGERRKIYFDITDYFGKM